MKALIRAVTGGGAALASVKYVLTLKGGAREEKKADLGARVGKTWVSDDLQNVDLSNHTKIAEMIEAPTKLWCSPNARHRDHFVVSAPNGASFEDFEQLVPEMLKDLTKEIEISTYLAVTHRDCPHPHVHVICDAYAPGVGRGRRRHFDKDELLELDSMDWTQAFGTPTPDVGAKHSARGVSILASKFKGAPKSKVDLCAQVVKSLGGVITDVGTMVRKLEKLENLPFKLNLRTKRGKIKDSAVIIGGSAKVRLDWIIKHESNLLNTEQFKQIDVDKKAKLDAIKSSVGALINQPKQTPAKPTLPEPTPPEESPRETTLPKQTPPEHTPATPIPANLKLPEPAAPKPAPSEQSPPEQNSLTKRISQKCQTVIQWWSNRISKSDEDGDVAISAPTDNNKKTSKPVSHTSTKKLQEQEEPPPEEKPL